MGVESVFLRELPGLIFLALGVLSQLYLGRRLGLRNRTNGLLAAVPVLVSILTRFRPITQLLPDGYSGVFLAGFVVLWCWALVMPAFVLWTLRRFPSRNFQPERRALLTASASVLCAAPIAALSAGIIIRKDFQVQEMDLKFPNLPKDLRGLRLLQISDIHIGDYFSAADLRRVVDACNGLRADLAFVTGDLITTKFDPLDSCLLELKRLRSASGIWGCLGNHEQHQKIEDDTTKRALQAGIHFLRQEAVQLGFGQSKLNLVGVDHQRARMPYLQHINELVSPDLFNLLLSHNPAVFPIAARQGFQLTLAGHTHGGQINIALAGENLNIADLVTPYTKGFYKLAESSLYVNSGLGTIGVPVRLGAPPEITLIRLCDS
ncbi:MAG TPA: metallophosphoesterase [Bryobacteraceae bacterium]|nr:metallophosphoesterase [Bryobacteraceae bacterium]